MFLMDGVGVGGGHDLSTFFKKIKIKNKKSRLPPCTAHHFSTEHNTSRVWTQVDAGSVLDLRDDLPGARSLIGPPRCRSGHR